MTTTKSKKKVFTHKADAEISGLGQDTVKLVDADNGNCLCYIGIKNDEEVVHFTKPVTLETLEAVVELINKKKFGKALTSGDFDRAQKFADRKFHQE